jgi:hypothetical protein
LHKQARVEVEETRHAAGKKMASRENWGSLLMNMDVERIGDQGRTTHKFVFHMRQAP